MASLQLLTEFRDRENTVSPLLQTVNASSQSLLLRYSSIQSNQDLREQEKISEILPTKALSLSSCANTLSLSDRIVIDLTQNSQDSFDGTNKIAVDGCIVVDLTQDSQESHRRPFADITDAWVSTHEKSNLPLFEGPIFEDPGEANAAGAGSRHSAATPSISNFADEPTRVSAISGPKSINEQSSISSNGVEPNLLLKFSDQSNALPGVSTTDDAHFIPATRHLTNGSNKPSLSNKLSCRERKRIIVSSIRRPPHVKKAMQLWLESTNRLLDPFREDNDCWFHPTPPPPRTTSIGTLRACGKIRRSFSWQDGHGKHNLVLNFGIVSKILFHAMTKMQTDGFVNNKWHLSHLCGNWTCLNPYHTTVEPGNVNISRNNCFSHRGGCLHDPKCMKEKKVNLGANGIPIYESSETSLAIHVGEADEETEDWSMPNFDDDNFSVHESLPVD